MINDDTLIKISRNILGYKIEWPEKVNQIKERLKDIKLGFPGIRNDHLSIVRLSDIKDDDIFIWDDYLWESTEFSDNAPIMLRKLNNSSALIEGIGCGLDSQRDPDRLKFRWKDTIDFSFPQDYLVLRVDVRPTLNGGPGYYYFFKSYRDFRL